MRLAFHRTSRGFTLIELLVVIGVIGILVGLSLPAVQAVRGTARRMQCQSHLKQIGLAMQAYHDLHGAFPLNTSFSHDLGPLGRSRSWMQGILPFIEKDALYDQILFGDTIVANSEVAETAVPLYLCPADAQDGVLGRRADVPPQWILGVTSYKACSGSNWEYGQFRRAEEEGRFAGSFDGDNEGNGLICSAVEGPVLTRMADVTDGTSHTYAAGETIAGWTKWAWWYSNNASVGNCAIPLNHLIGQPEKALANLHRWHNNSGFMSRHPGGANFVMVDGSVQFVSQSIDQKVYWARATIQGGETTVD